MYAAPASPSHLREPPYVNLNGKVRHCFGEGNMSLHVACQKNSAWLQSQLSANVRWIAAECYE